MHLALPLCVLGVALKIIYTSLFEARLKLKKDKTDDGELANSSAESSRCLSRWQSQRNAQRPRGAIIEIAWPSACRCDILLRFSLDFSSRKLCFCTVTMKRDAWVALIGMLFAF
jgi:hypothetical protein